MTEPIKHATQCTRCHAPLVLTQDPECPPITVEKWLRIIVCNRCGAYLEALRKVDDMIAFICQRFLLSKGTKHEENARIVTRESLVKWTKELNRILTKRWQTVCPWDEALVDLLMEKADKSRVAVRFEESTHRKVHQDFVRSRQLATASTPNEL